MREDFLCNFNSDFASKISIESSQNLREWNFSSILKSGCLRVGLFYYLAVIVGRPCDHSSSSFLTSRSPHYKRPSWAWHETRETLIMDGASVQNMEKIREKNWHVKIDIKRLSFCVANTSFGSQPRWQNWTEKKVKKNINKPIDEQKKSIWWV